MKKRPGKGAEVGRHDRVGDAAQAGGGGKQEQVQAPDMALSVSHHTESSFGPEEVIFRGWV